jgi:HD-GYP domain-containing protein (c-di-GMP phosphodiesterase class II)
MPTTIALDPFADGASALLTALQRHDGATGWHSRRVSLLARRVGALLGVTGAALDELEEAALVHDAGKLRVPKHVLRKPGPLSPDEWSLMQQHPEWGAELVSNLDGLGRHAETVRAHHETWSGEGYPTGRSGHEIPLAARIISACDAYDAMTTERPYAERRTQDEALAELRACAGTQFDPVIVAALEAVLGEVEAEAAAG